MALVARGRSLFGDPTSEIQDLTQVVKQDLAKLNTDIAHLQQQVRARSGRETKHMSSHSSTVVVSLQVSGCGERGVALGELCLAGVGSGCGSFGVMGVTSELMSLECPDTQTSLGLVKCHE